MGVEVDLDHVGDDPFEERPVVADDHHAGAQAEHPRLEPGEAVEVEVVGRLVEQEHVESRQQQRGQRRPRRLTARQHERRPIEQFRRESEVGPHLTDAGVEVGRPERHPLVERRAVRVVAARHGGGERGRGRLQSSLGAR